MRRYPLEPLLAATGLTASALGARVGLSGTSLKNARELGLTEQRADRVAVACGLHPAEVWPSILGDHRRDQWAASARKRWATDPEHRANRTEYMRAYRAGAKRAVNAQKKAWCDQNRERVRAQNREANRRYRARKKAS